MFTLLTRFVVMHVIVLMYFMVKKKKSDFMSVLDSELL